MYTINEENKMSLNVILSKDLVFIQKDFSSASEVIKFLSEQLLEKSYVKDDFLNAVLKREEEAPTGLYLGGLNVAIPHAGAQYVLKSSIAIAILKKPVQFKQMDNPSKEIPVYLVFLIATDGSSGRVKFLSKLASVFEDQSFVKSLYYSQTSEDVINLLSKVIIDEKETSIPR
jgi:PTS system galactitol-specific IIA component